MHSSQRWLSAALQPTGRERKKKNQPTEEDRVLGGPADPSAHAGQSQFSFGSSFGGSLTSTAKALPPNARVPQLTGERNAHRDQPRQRPKRRPRGR